MASSKVMASSTSTNTDLVRQTSTYSLTIGDLQGDQNKNFGSMSMDELMRNIYGDNPPSSDMIVATPGGGTTGVDGETALSRQGSFPLHKDVGNKTVDEVWKEISGSNGAADSDRKMRDAVEGPFDQFNMTLEEFLTKAGAVREEDMKIPQMGAVREEDMKIPQMGAVREEDMKIPQGVGPVHGFMVGSHLDTRYPQQQGEGSGSGSILWLGSGGDRAGGGRGKRRAVLEPIDKVAQQRQRRMIKNRESAARSRERKQAYTVELESLVTQLEEENARLQREQAERIRERHKQLQEIVIPIDEKRRPRGQQVLRRSCSGPW